MKQKIMDVVATVTSFAAVWLLSLAGTTIFETFEHSSEHGLLMVLFLTGLLFALSTMISYVSRITKLPSFVIAILFGIIAKPLLAPITTSHESLSVLVGLGAALILFSGGLETPYKNFQKLVAKILSLSFVVHVAAQPHPLMHVPQYRLILIL